MGNLTSAQGDTGAAAGGDVTSGGEAVDTGVSQGEAQVSDDTSAPVGDTGNKPDQSAQAKPADNQADDKAKPDAQDGKEKPKDQQAGDKNAPVKSVDDLAGLTIHQEGVSVDEPSMGAFKQFAVKHGLSAQLAQDLLDLQVGTIVDQHNRQVDACRETLQSDWGQHFDTNLAKANRMVDFIDSKVPGFKAAMATTLGNQPAVGKFLLWVHEAVADDTLTAPAMGYGKTEQAMDEEAWIKQQLGMKD